MATRQPAPPLPDIPSPSHLPVILKIPLSITLSLGYRAGPALHMSTVPFAYLHLMPAFSFCLQACGSRQREKAGRPSLKPLPCLSPATPPSILQVFWWSLCPVFWSHDPVLGQCIFWTACCRRIRESGSRATDLPGV